MQTTRTVGSLAGARLVAIAALLALGGCVSEAGSQPLISVGDAYEITIERESVTSGDAGSSGTSFDRDTLVERVIAIRDDGVELEFDLPAETSPEARARDWQFPARILKTQGGRLELLNKGELETRLDAWLRSGWGEQGRQFCGRWLFTWTAIKIECDPQAVVPIIERFILAPDDLRDGATYRDPGAIGAARLRAGQTSSGIRALTAELPLNGDVAQRARAESDVVIAQLTSQPAISVEDALRARSGERVSGVITVTFELDAEGNVTRRTRVIRSSLVDGKGSVERTAVTENATRQRLP